MVCETCMNRAPFLWIYATYFACESHAIMHFFLFRLFSYSSKGMIMCMLLSPVVPQVTKTSLSKEDEEDNVAGNKEEKDLTLLSCNSGHDEPSTSNDCQKETKVRNRSI